MKRRKFRNCINNRDEIMSIAEMLFVGSSILLFIGIIAYIILFILMCII